MNKKAFGLVELLVAMAIIAILVGLAVLGITIVQRNARDTERRSKVSDIEIALTGLIVLNQALPASFSAAQQTQLTIGNKTVSIPNHLSRQATDATGAADTSGSVTDYCYGRSGNLFVVGVELEGGGFYFKTNTQAVYSSAPAAAFTAAPTGSGPNCTDINL